MSKSSSLVECCWLFENLSNENIVILDGSWHMPSTNRNGRAEFENAHIPGARFFDIDKVSDQTSPYPHMLPDAAFFSEKAGELGIANDSHIIVYDTLGLFSAARVWWMFRAFGHEKISILNGGFKKWVAEGYAVSKTCENKIKTTEYKAKLNLNMVIDYVQLTDDLSEQRSVVLDARSQGRFCGSDPEPRPELSSGHMPGSASLPFSKLLEADSCFKSTEQLKTIFGELDVKEDSRVITSCGSGVTAAVLSFGLHLIGRDDVKLYDGSWSEYAAQERSVILKD